MYKIIYNATQESCNYPQSDLSIVVDLHKTARKGKFPSAYIVKLIDNNWQMVEFDKPKLIEIKSLGDLELLLTIHKGFSDDEFDSFVEFLESKGIFFGGSYDDKLVDGVLDIGSADITLDSVEVLINDFLKTL